MKINQEFTEEFDYISFDGDLYSLDEFIRADESGHVYPESGLVRGVLLNGVLMRMKITDYKMSIPVDKFEEATLAQLGDISGEIEILWNNKR